MRSKEIEYLAGHDYLGEERWVVGYIDRQEQRQDGEWFLVHPKVPDVWGVGGSRWVTSDQVRAWTRPSPSHRR